MNLDLLVPVGIAVVVLVAAAVAMVRVRGAAAALMWAGVACLVARLVVPVAITATGSTAMMRSFTVLVVVHAVLPIVGFLLLVIAAAMGRPKPADQPYRPRPAYGSPPPPQR